ncbi:MAG: hypothetical protein ABRQ39_14570 [Candidatus Eremiobacterota bacterium]
MRRDLNFLKPDLAVTDDFTETYPSFINIEETGISESGEAIKCLTAGHGHVNVLVILAHNEPLNSIFLNYLLHFMVLNEEFITDADFSWHIIKLPSNKKDILSGFPLNYRHIKYNNTHSDTRALMKIIDKTRIDLLCTFYSDENSDFSYYITDECPSLCKKIYKLLKKYNLSSRKPEFPFVKYLYKKGIYKIFSSKDIYDYYEKNVSTFEEIPHIPGENVESYTSLRWHSFCVKCNIPDERSDLLHTEIISLLCAADYVENSFRKKEEFPSKVYLCSLDNISCSGCCIDSKEDKEVLKTYVEENSIAFEKYFAGRECITFSDLEDYIFTREGAVISRTKEFYRDNCSLAGYMDEKHSRTGCLIHPKRTGGMEIREGLWMLICAPYEKCYRDLLWKELPVKAKEDFIEQVKGLDWVDYAKTIYKLIPELYARYKLKHDIKNSHFFKDLLDLSLNNAPDIKKNLHLLDDFYSLNEHIEFSHEFLEEYLNKFGQLFLEKCLSYIEKHYNVHLLSMKIPVEKLTSGHNIVNGNINYILFIPSRNKTQKTILLATCYDNQNKFSNNSPENSKTTGFLIHLIEEIINNKNRHVNYMFSFFGADNNELLPLAGSFYFSERLSAGLSVENYNIFPEDIICQIFLKDILQGKYYGNLICHIPVFRSRETLLEEYIYEKIYDDIENPDESSLSSIGDFVTEYTGRGKLLDVVRNVDKVEAIISGIKKLTSFRKENIYDLLLHILNDTEQSERITDLIRERFHFFEIPDSAEDLKESLRKKGVLREGRPFYINTHRNFTEKLCELLSDEGFDVSEERIGRRMGFYPLLSLNVSTVSIEGLPVKEEKEIKFEIFKEKFIEFLEHVEADSM